LNNGNVLIAGGSNGSAVLSSTELYDPSTGTFTPIASLTNTRELHTATLLNNGTVLITGGFGSSLSSAELYDPSTGTFTVTGNMTASRYYHTATLLNNGKVLITGGYNSSALSSAELYDPSTGTFTVTGSMTTVRYGHTATLLNNGKVLIAGGDSSSALASAELYDPSTGTFVAIGNMTSARSYQTATLLNNGKALLAGGSDGSIVASSAELYQPATLTPSNLVSIAVTPVNPSIAVGGTQQFIATGTFSGTSPQQLASVTWSSSNISIATISNDASNPGTALAVGPGSATISACAGSVCGSTILTAH
jgi:hypothetical protein